MMGIVVRSPAGSSRDKYYYTSHYRYSADASHGTLSRRDSRRPGRRTVKLAGRGRWVHRGRLLAYPGS